MPILAIIRTPSATLTAGVLSKISCIHSDEMVCDHGDHSKGTKIVRQVVQRLVAYHFGSKGSGRDLVNHGLDIEVDGYYI